MACRGDTTLAGMTDQCASGFGRCLVIRKYQTSLRKYSNGSVDVCKGPPAMDNFNGKDPRWVVAWAGKQGGRALSTCTCSVFNLLVLWVCLPMWRSRSKRYHALDLDGICMVGEPLENGSIMVNKESPTSVAELDGGGAWEYLVWQWRE